MLEHLQTSALIFIAQSINIQPNPGPTALYILKDFTNPGQRELFITAKRPKLKLTRYEHLKSTKSRENINLSCVDQTLSQPTVNVQFHKQIMDKTSLIRMSKAVETIKI